MKKTAVVMSCNDNYGDHLIERATMSLSSLVLSFDEVIYVDWGTPEGKPPLHHEVRDYIPSTGKLRCIEVERDFSDSLNLPEGSQHCVEVLGSNIGIRRASHDFIAKTNIDIVIPSFDHTKFDDKTMYTSPRYQVPTEAVLDLHSQFRDDVCSLMELFQCSRSRIERQRRCTDPNDPWSLVICCGDYQAAHRQVWEGIKGFEEGMVYRLLADGNLMMKAKKAGWNIDVADSVQAYHLGHTTRSYVIYNQECKINDRDYYLGNQETTDNPDSWGFADVTFKEEVI